MPISTMFQQTISSEEQTANIQKSEPTPAGSLLFYSVNYSPHRCRPQKNYSHSAQYSRNEPARIRRFTQSDILREPVRTHCQQQRSRRPHRDTLPANKHRESRALPEKYPGTARAHRHLIPADKETALRHLMTPGSRSETHCLYPEFVPRHAFHFLPQLLQTQ